MHPAFVIWISIAIAHSLILLWRLRLLLIRPPSCTSWMLASYGPTLAHEEASNVWQLGSEKFNSYFYKKRL